MITIELSETTQTTSQNRSCPNIARKLIQEGADPSTEIDFIRDGKRSFAVNTLAWWSKVQDIQG
jgi:hypothetical protein